MSFIRMGTLGVGPSFDLNGLSFSSDAIFVSPTCGCFSLLSSVVFIFRLHWKRPVGRSPRNAKHDAQNTGKKRQPLPSHVRKSDRPELIAHVTASQCKHKDNS